MTGKVKLTQEQADAFFLLTQMFSERFIIDMATNNELENFEAHPQNIESINGMDAEAISKAYAGWIYVEGDEIND